MRKFATWVSRAIISVGLIVLILLGAGLYERMETDKTTAARHIQAVFVEECGRRGIDVKNFEGPILQKSDFWHYDFYWKNMKNQKFVLGVVQFFPIQSEIWFPNQGSKI